MEREGGLCILYGMGSGLCGWNLATGGGGGCLAATETLVWESSPGRRECQAGSSVREDLWGEMLCIVSGSPDQIHAPPPFLSQSFWLKE